MRLPLFAQLCQLAMLGLLLASCSSPVSKTSVPPEPDADTSESAEPQPGLQVHPVNAQEGLALIDAGDVFVLDIRTVREFQSGTLPGAHNIVWGSADFREQLATLPREQPILLFCRSGNRTSRSLRVFEELGFHTIHHLRHGILRVPAERVVLPSSTGG